MGAFVYAGSMQYLAVDLLTGGASFIATALATLAVNARHLFYGITMIERYRGAGIKKPYMIFSLTDETYSLVCEGEIDHKFFFGVSLLNHIYWVSGCCIGSIVGGFISLKGIDFALTALFVTVFTEQWLSNRDHTAAACGVLSSVLCLLIFGADRFLIPTMIVISVSLTVIKKIMGGAVLE
jgi:4-azaleucine resistance transporter AzlC